jgi:hypothetical protein
MNDRKQTGVTRRDAIKQLSAAGAAVALGGGIIRGQGTDIVIGGSPVEIVVSAVSPSTVRILVLPIAAGAVAPLPVDGALAQNEWGGALARARAAAPLKQVTAGNLRVRFTDTPPTLHVETLKGDAVQTLTLDTTTAGDEVSSAERTAARPRRRRTAVRSQGHDRPRAQRTGRLSAPHARGARADSVADRH